MSVVKLLKNGKSILDYLLLCLWHKQTQKVNTTITALDSNLQSREIFESKYLGHRKTCRRRTCWKSQIKTTEQYTGNLQSSPHFQRTSDFCEQIRQKNKEFASTKIITIRSWDGCYHFIITAIFFLSFCLFFPSRFVSISLSYYSLFLYVYCSFFSRLICMFSPLCH